MAFEIPVLDIALKADADLSTTGQYLFVKVTGVQQVGLCAATTDTPLGILQNKPGSLQAGAVRVYGVSKLVADATLTAGSLIATAANGKGTMTATGTAGAYTMGIALDTAAAANGVASVFLTHAGRGA
jgi:hypothetical protein